MLHFRPLIPSSASWRIWFKLTEEAVYQVINSACLWNQIRLKPQTFHRGMFNIIQLVQRYKVTMFALVDDLDTWSCPKQHGSHLPVLIPFTNQLPSSPIILTRPDLVITVVRRWLRMWTPTIQRLGHGRHASFCSYFLSCMLGFASPHTANTASLVHPIFPHRWVSHHWQAFIWQTNEIWISGWGRKPHIVSYIVNRLI